jgi:hydroxymethylpyrimidine kinase/phosphomethylpyrimidine kinase
MISTSGAQLLPEAAIKILCESLLPLTTILTPNLPEAKLLLWAAGVGFEEDPETVQDVVDIAQAVQRLGPKYVLLKGGHLPLTKDRLASKTDADRDIVLNVLVGAGQTVLMESKYLQTKNTHGTGCSLACK